MTAAASPPVDPLSARLAAAHLRLSHARDVHEVVTSIAAIVAPYAPHDIDLRYLHLDARGQPEVMQPLAVWQGGRLVLDHPFLTRRARASDTAISRQWIAAPYDVLVVEDVAYDPRCDDHIRALIAPCRGLVALPLYSSHPAGWQGLVVLHWTDPHTPSAEELLVYRAVQHVAAAVVAGHRSSIAFEAALAEARALYRVSARINEAATPADILAVVTELALSAGASGGTLLLVERGDPPTVRVAAQHPAPDRLALGRAGELPQFDGWRADPDAPATLDDLADPRAPSLERAFPSPPGARSLLLLPLRWQARVLGYIHLAWHEPHRFSDGERRLFRGLARQASAVLDNRLLFERTHQAVHDNRTQEQTLEALLDHLPLGVTVYGLDGTRLRINRAGLALHDLDEGKHRSVTDSDIRTFHLGTDRKIERHERVSILAMRSGEIRANELEIEHRDGRRIVAHCTAIPTRDDDGAVNGCILLFQDITRRIHLARERDRMHAAMLAAQAAALAERQAPVIPLTDDILVVPLVGSIDPERGEPLLAALLEQGSRAGVKTTILDLTGVPSLDAAGTAVLLAAARGLRLRGVLTLFSGLRPDVAWSLAASDLDLDGVHAVGTLQAALALARRR
ncbi:MAG: GAF domain-containing protein [Myxococcales bacterium]|nr:GAF domain-containing protein [Myxococcales bacterium]